MAILILLIQILMINVSCVKSNDEMNTTLIGSCTHRIFCNDQVLSAIQNADIYNTLKEFLDMSIMEGETVDSILKSFNELMKKHNGKPSKYDMLSFLESYFHKLQLLEIWRPDDYKDTPKILSQIKDVELRNMARKIIDTWPRLGRKIRETVLDSPESHTLIYVPNGFIIPSGKYEEYHYWDMYWTARGLLLSDMDKTVRGILTNHCYLLKKFGFIPTGGRIYYISRSNPPLLMKLAREYLDKTGDLDWLRPNIPLLEKELFFWINKRFTIVTINKKTYSLAQYYVNSTGPRPEEYHKDLKLADIYQEDIDKETFYNEVKSAAESRWEDSTRFYRSLRKSQFENASIISVSKVIPADLNGILYGAFNDMAQMYSKIGQLQNKTAWTQRAEELKKAINSVLWDEEDGIWYDYNLITKKRVRMFACSNLVPLWTKVYDDDNQEFIGKRVSEYLIRKEIVNYVGGIPPTKKGFGNWDYPFVYPYHQYIIVHGLKDTGEKQALELMHTFVDNFLNACIIGFKSTGMLYDKYHADIPGRYGGGRDFERTSGFASTNGVVLDFIDIYTTSGFKMKRYNRNLRNIIVLLFVRYFNI
ncbi:trehalase-like [Onthophagus taurus]|uniref:trehalase-like n=1 Tax=Onthophagus taurus TaxID=166361 RepID=UPI0039BE7022